MSARHEGRKHLAAEAIKPGGRGALCGAKGKTGPLLFTTKSERVTCGNCRGLMWRRAEPNIRATP